MSILLRQLLNLRSFAIINRSFYSSPMHASYEGDGKTTITVLNKNFDYGLMINNVSEHGFVLNNGIRTVGPMVAFSKLMLSWNIASSPDMSKESFSLVLNLEPKLDVVIIGLDDEYPHCAPFILNIKEIFRIHKIPLEILPVYHACSTFNFLNSENRYIAAALIPPKLKFVEDFLLQDKVKFDVCKQGNKEKKNAGYQNAEVSPAPYSNSLNAEISAGNREIKEYFKVRRSWKVEEKIQLHPPDKHDKNT